MIETPGGFHLNLLNHRIGLIIGIGQEAGPINVCWYMILRDSYCPQINCEQPFGETKVR